MSEITPTPREGHATFFDPLPHTGTLKPVLPTPRAGHVTYFDPLRLGRAYRHIGMVRGARG